MLYDGGMSFRNIYLSLGLVMAVLCLPVSSVAETAQFLTVIDGDSMLVSYKGRSQEVRLIGIDAPEWGQEYGTQAKSRAINFCYGKALRLEFDKGRKDRYGRLLAYVYCGNKMLNEFMLQEGLAIAVKVKPNEKYYERFKKIEAQARKKKRGFWLRGGLKQTPAQWRKQKGK